ncbi:MAG: hypothetical protein ACM3QU_09640 [Verrucomicrobiota bacterium]
MRRLFVVVLCLAVLALPGAVLGAPPFRATLVASTHAPKVSSNWFYVVSVTDRHGKLIKATITTRILDPLGGVHPVEFGCCKKNVVNHPFTGVFGDFVTFPLAAKGFKVSFQVVIHALGGTQVLKYWVKPT